MTRISSLIAITAAAIALLAAGSASAVPDHTYTDVVGTSVTFSGIQETINSPDDAGPLWEQPTGAGDYLIFDPGNYLADANGSGADSFDFTGSLLELEISGNAPDITLTEFTITEFGDNLFAGAGGTLGTSTTVSMAGFLTITEDINGSITPVVIGINDSASFDFVNDPGTTLWSLTATIDITAYVTDATKAVLSLDNDLLAFSEAGTFAKIQKKVVLQVVPEPSTGLLFAGGLLGMAFRARNRRS